MRGANRVRSLVRKALGCGTLEDHSLQQRVAMWPPAAQLEDVHVRNCRLFPNRYAMTEHLPKGSVCAEIGVETGDFSQHLLTTVRPAKLYLIDFAEEATRNAERRFAEQVRAGVVQVHRGDSATTLASFPDAYFDWVYIDADHAYDGVRKDLEAARVKVKPGGPIALNDYTYFGPLDFAKYGVVEAVHEFCLKYRYEIAMMALHPRLYNDVVLRPIG